jgi:CDGSH iron-sulfur domain-containing protein 3
LKAANKRQLIDVISKPHCSPFMERFALRAAFAARSLGLEQPTQFRNRRMDKGHIAGTAPIKVAVEAGKDYFWCSCGQSKNQPFCDGSHKGSEFSPVKWSAEESGDKWFCSCKQTNGQPFCDGSHKAL